MISILSQIYPEQTLQNNHYQQRMLKEQSLLVIFY
jgi:hypothetical protein